MLPTETFLEALQQSKLLPEERLARVREAVADPKGPKAPPQIADWLIEQEWITRWQAKMLLANKRAFFLGKYKLLKMIGQGGMGSVFKAEQQPLGRIVAIKVMAERLVKDKGSVARFQREIQAAASLNHPNIVAAYDADCVNRTHFLVMEYVDGQTLDDLVRKSGRLSIAEGCDYIRQAAVGLQHAFERGMTHRDIKPSNLFLTKPAEGDEGGPLVKILDMGLARVTSEASEETGLTHTGQVLGTPDYIAPEQAQNTRAADVRSDIFSLGCTLFRLLTGDLPYGGTTLMEKLMARGMHAAKRIRAARADVPPALDAIVAKMLAREPADRYQTPAEVVDALAAFSRAAPAGTKDKARSVAESDGGHTTALDPVSPTPLQGSEPPDSSLEHFFQQLSPAAALDTPLGQLEEDTSPGSSVGPERRDRSSKWSSTAMDWTKNLSGRTKAIVAAAAGAVVLLVLGVVMVWTQMGATTLVVEWPESERGTGTLEVGGRSVPLGSGTLRFSGWAGRQSVKATRRGYQPITEQWLAARGEVKTLSLRWKPTAETRRRQEFQALDDSIRTLQRNLSGGSVRPADRAVDDVWNQVLAYQKTQRGTKDAMQIAASASRLPVPADQLQRKSIPREILAVAGGGKPRQTPKELVAIFGDNRLRHVGITNCAAVSPDGKWVATGGQNSRVRLWSTANPRLAKTLVGHGRSTSHLRFSSDSKHLYGMAPVDRVAVWSVDAPGGEQPLRVFTIPEGNWGHMRSLAISRDERWLAVGTENTDVFLWDLTSDARPRALKHHDGRILCVSFSDDGSTLVSVGFGPREGNQRNPGWQSAAVWNTADGQLRSSIPKLPHEHAAVSPDARLLANRNGRRIQIWDLERGEKLRELLANGEPRSLSFSPDGRRLCVTCERVELWDTTTWETTGQEFVEDALETRFTPDGKGLLLVSGNRAKVLRVDGSGELFPTRPSVLCALFSPDGRTVYCGTSERTIVSFDPATGREQQTYKDLPGPPQILAISPDGREIAAACQFGRHPKHTLVVLDVPSGQDRFVANELNVLGLRSHPAGGQWAVGTFAGDLRVFDGYRETFSVRTWKRERRELFCVDWHPTKNLIAAGSGTLDPLRLWEVGEQLEVDKLPGHQGNVNAVRFSPDGQTLYSGSDDGTIRAWDVSKHTPRSLFVTHGHPIQSIAVSLDGKTLIAGARDGSLVVAALPEGDPHRTIDSHHAGAILSACLSPEGRHAITVNEDGTAFLLRLEEWKP